MIKKDITFYNYADVPVQVTETFYFNYTQIEGVEIELTYGDLDETIQVLNNTEDAKKAYQIFKEILIGAVGVRSADNLQFDKSQDAKDKFTKSAAMSTLIWSFIEDPDSAAAFMEGMLPANLVAEGKARIERERLEAALASQTKPQDRQQPAQLETAAPVLETETAVQITRTDEEIQNTPVSELSNAELERLVALRQAQA